MDLEEEWEFVPDDGFLEIPDDGKNKILSRKYVKNYFICPSQKFVESTEDSRVPNQLVPLPIHLKPNIQKTPDLELVKEINIEFTEKIKAQDYNIGVAEETEQDSVSQIFFKKMKENEFDMKMDSPKSTGRGILPPRSVKEEDEMVAWEESNDDGSSVNMWKWSLTGIGAICSFGVAAAATICIIILGSGPKNRHHHQQNHQNLRFQIYADDKVCEFFLPILLKKIYF